MPIRMHAARAARAISITAFAGAGLLPLAACGRAAAPVPEGAAPPRLVEILPGGRVLTVPAVRDTTRAYRLLARRTGDTTTVDFGLTTLGERAHTEDGTFVQVMTTPKQASYDTLMVRVAGLAPRWERLRFGPRTIRVEYDGARVTRWEQVGDSAARISTTEFPTPVFAFNQAHTLVRSIPLRVGYTAVLPLFAATTAELEHDTITVTGAPAAGRRGWTVRFADPVIVATYTLDAATREILGYRVAQRSGRAEFWWDLATR
jgi:hypothetical protein